MKNTPGLVSLLSAALIASAACSVSAQMKPAAPPNVIFILPDQWRAQAFGFAGDPNVKTPNLDRLAGESVRFTHAVSAMPVCCPTRASIMTGQRPLTTGVFMNDVPVDPGSMSVAKVMGSDGYDTGYIGKWHLNGGDRTAVVPKDRRLGFDYWKASECTHDYNRSFYDGEGKQKIQWQGYDAIAQTADASNYLRTHAKSDKPFFLFLAWGPPHSPYESAPEKYRAMYSREKLVLRPNVPPAMSFPASVMLAHYYAHCSALDDCLGKLWETLKETGLENNTILVFSSDHGDLLGSQASRNKQQPYDECIRIPLLVHWPAGLGTAPRKLSAPISSEDIMPTLLGLCGLAVPSSVEGLDYHDYIKGGKDPSDGAALISCAAPFGQWSRKAGGKEFRGLRTERYTYVRDLKGPWMLFDNETDPYQQTNLVGRPECALLQAELDTRLDQKLELTHDKFLPAETYIRQWGYLVDKDGTIPYHE